MLNGDHGGLGAIHQTGYLYAQEILIFDYVKFAESLHQAIRENAEGIAKENDLEIEFIRKPKTFRKQYLVQPTDPGWVF